LAALARAVNSESQRKTDLLPLPPHLDRLFRSEFDRACFSPFFSSDESAISCAIAAKKMRKNPAASRCAKPAEMLRICGENPVENAVDILRQSGGLAVDKRAKSG